ncbi:TRAP transporter permease [Bacillus horti]|uniref:TRAP transporter 4TM/12TM fusion protein n=1 Tax=Caldalkalibacillus horti TaxID=77523 RepID=A0ABT9W591_9BACI|nr:TRAP transporter permease [Bacillus horti]MDQ0168417.1 TRAP transporter 4TM/12TM fusion protein [Bacillus horti]
MSEAIKTVEVTDEPFEQKRSLEGRDKQIVYAVSLLMATLQVYLIIFSLTAPMINTGIFLMFVAVLVFLLYKPAKRITSNAIPWFDWLAAFLSAIPFLYGVLFYEEIIARATFPTVLDKVMMILAVLAILEMSRRTIGIILPCIALLFVLYAIWGGNLPGIFVHRGYDLDRLTNTFFMTTNGIYGSPTKVAATMVFMFVFFGAFLNATGASKVITDGSFSIAGRFTGGPAKVAIFASALMGSVSGSASANVATTGQLTIPLMKKVGYNKDFAAGVESAASTGGTITPPIMGAGAFIMAETTGIPYSDIVKAAIIPALLFYMAVFTSTHFEAKKLGLRGLPKKDLPQLIHVLKKGFHVLLPLVFLIVLILMYFPVMHAAFYSTIALIVAAMLHPATRIKIKEIFNAVANSAHMVLQAAAACACAGIVIGVLNLTGLGLRFSTVTLQLAGHSLFLALFFTMVIAIILGMGLPPVAAYIIGAAVAAPALTNLGFPLLASHLFIFYFAAISSITPPVAVTAYIGAGIAGGSPIKTAVISCLLGLPAFIVPYMFMFSDVFLLQSEPLEFILLIVPTTIGFICLSTGIIGFFSKRLIMVERMTFIASGILLLIFDYLTSSIGLGLLIGILIYHYKRKDNVRVQATSN